MSTPNRLAETGNRVTPEAAVAAFLQSGVAPCYEATLELTGAGGPRADLLGALAVERYGLAEATAQALRHRMPAWLAGVLGCSKTYLLGLSAGWRCAVPDRSPHAGAEFDRGFADGRLCRAVVAERVRPEFRPQGSGVEGPEEWAALYAWSKHRAPEGD